MIPLPEMQVNEVEVFVVEQKISEQHFLTLFMAFYQRVDGQLSAYAFWALITFIRNFGVGSTSLPLGELSKVIGIQVNKLRGVLKELGHQGILK